MSDDLLSTFLAKKRGVEDINSTFCNRVRVVLLLAFVLNQFSKQNIWHFLESSQSCIFVSFCFEPIFKAKHLALSGISPCYYGPHESSFQKMSFSRLLLESFKLQDKLRGLKKQITDIKVSQRNCDCICISSIFELH